jgi:uncharacterized protein YdcH (DUF465 family)
MTLLLNDLYHEFPEFTDAIHALKAGNQHFARLFDEYNLANDEIRRLEGIGIPVTDETVEDAKKKRLHLKDEVYAMLLAQQRS